MPEKDFIIWLDGQTYIKVDFVTSGGNVLSFTVRLMRIEDDGEFNVARYDIAHGVPHLDVNGRRKGQIRKVWHRGVPREKVLADAIADFKQNYEEYIAEFSRN
jgi:hypothetical protein